MLIAYLPFFIFFSAASTSRAIIGGRRPSLLDLFVRLGRCHIMLSRIIKTIKKKAKNYYLLSSLLSYISLHFYAIYGVLFSTLLHYNYCGYVGLNHIFLLIYAINTTAFDESLYSAVALHSSTLHIIASRVTPPSIFVFFTLPHCP